jgi:F0F1-type ATP synthase assembly protein I
MSWRRIAYTLIGIGWFIAACIVLGAVGGWWLDSKLDTKPWLALLGVTMGTVVAMFGVYRMVRPGLEKNKRKDKGKD